MRHFSHTVEIERHPIRVEPKFTDIEESSSVLEIVEMAPQRRQKFQATDLMTASAIRLFELQPKTPVTSMTVVTQLLDTTKPTATKAIELLRNAGVLYAIGQRKRDRLYQYKQYLDLLR